MYKTDTEFPWVRCRALAPHQQMPASTRQSQTSFGSGQELDPGMHRSESGSGSQAEQQAGSSSEAGHGQRERDPHDPPALNWVWRTWRGIPRWSISGHLFCPPLPANATASDSYLQDLRGLPVTLAAMVTIINRDLFLPSIPTVTSV